MCRTSLPVARFIKTSPMFNWANIIKNFENAFKKTFTMDRKAHFDNLPEELSTVDGAKAHWCILLLLDAMIYLLRNEGFNHSTRRAFNQHQILYDCIFQELKNMDEKSCEVLSEEKKALVNPAEYNKEVTGKFSNLSVILLDTAWQSMELLEAQLVSECPASKAKNKFPIIVRLLTQHEAFNKLESNLHTILQAVTTRALFHFNPDKPIVKKSDKVPKSKPSIMEALHEYRKARRESLLLLLSQRLATTPSTTATETNSVAAAAVACQSGRKIKVKRSTSPTPAESSKHVRTASPPRNNTLYNTHVLPLPDATEPECEPEFDPADFDMFDGDEFNFDDDIFGNTCNTTNNQSCCNEVSSSSIPAATQVQEQQEPILSYQNVANSQSSADFFSVYMADLAKNKTDSAVKNDDQQSRTSCDSPYQGYTSSESSQSTDNSNHNSSSEGESSSSDCECDSIFGDELMTMMEDPADLYEWLAPLVNEPSTTALTA